MGLDVYLETIEEHEQDAKHWSEWEALWKRRERGEITEREFESLSSDITPYAGKVDVPSKQHPDHLFNRRYLRSSYNGAGFNRAVPDFLGSEGEGSLYWIFEPMEREWDGDEGHLGPEDVPKLEECRHRAASVANRLTACDPLRAEAIHAPPLGGQDHLWSKLPTDDEVLAWYRGEATNKRPSFAEDGGYSNAKGTVFGFKTGMEVLAITLGRDVLGQACPIIVYRSDAVESYVSSAEITAEFCDEAIELIKRDGSARIVWSG